MNKEIDDSVPLAPINEIIQQFNRRTATISVIMFLSLPASIVALVLYIILISASGLSFYTTGILALLFFSSILSLAAIVIVPDYLSAISDQMEKTARSVSFSITLPEGESAQVKILNQMRRTDYRVRKLLKSKKGIAQTNVHLQNQGIDCCFDVLVYRRPDFIVKLLRGYVANSFFVRRFESKEPIGNQEIISVKKDVENALKIIGYKAPKRVLIISTAGFKEDVFSYTRTKEGKISTRLFPSLACQIELIKEDLDGTYDVLSF